MKPMAVQRSGSILPGRYPLTLTALRGPFAKALKVAGIAHFRLHDLRHTRARGLCAKLGRSRPRRKLSSTRVSQPRFATRTCSTMTPGARAMRVSPEIVPNAEGSLRRNPRNRALLSPFCITV